MFNSFSTRIVVIALATSLALAACEKDEPEAETSLLTAADSLLQYVPADTPYVIANIEALPDELFDKLEPKLNEVLASYRAMLHAGFTLADEDADGDSGKSENLLAAEAVINELSSLMSLDGLRSIGFDRQSTGVLYGNGLLPVLRLEVSDEALFEQAIARVEESAGQVLPVASVGETSYRYIEAGKVKIILTTLENQVVITLAPVHFDELQLGRLLGLELPDVNIADSGVLQGIADEYGFTNHYVGLVDIEGLIGTFLGGASGLDVDLLTLLPDETRPNLTEVCRAEFMDLASVAPRMVFGYTELSGERIGSQAVIELRSDIAAGIATLPAIIPGLGGDQGGLMSFGMSIDVMAARKFYESRLDLLDAEPFGCEELSGIQDGVAAGRQALSQPVPPMIYDVKGFLAVIQNIEGLDLGSNMPPESVDGRFMLAMDNAPALISMGAMFSPELAALSIESDGEPVPFESPQLQVVAEVVYIAMNEDGLALSVGEGMEQGLSDMLSADASGDGTIASFSMDASRYYAFIGEAISMADADDDKPMPPEMRAALNNMMLAFSDFYDRMSADVRLTGRGIEIDTVVTLKD